MWRLTGKVEDRTEPLSESFFNNFKYRRNLSEAAVKTGKLYPVYIVLFSNDTKFGKLIRLATGSEYSHAVVSLDSTMNNMYSFSDIPYNEAKFFCAGFVRESIWSPEYELNRHFRVLVTFVDKTGYDKMQKKIDYFIEHYKDYDYNDVGLIQYYFNFKNTKKHDETKKMKWFCSEFTAKIINSSEQVEGFDDVLQSPEDLLTASPNVIDLGKFTIPEFKEKDLIAKTKAAEKEFRKHSTLPKDVITEDADEIRYEAIDEAALADLFKKNKAKKKEKKFNERDVQQYTYNIDWKKLYDEFVKLFPKNNPKMRFDLFNVFVRDYFVPFKVSATNMTEKYIEEMRKVHKYVKNGIIKLIDAVSATIFYEDDKKKEGAVVWPDSKLKDKTLTESVLNEGFFTGFAKNNKQNQKDATREYNSEDENKVKELYGLTASPTTKEYKNENALISDIENDCKTWINKMFQSNEYKKCVNEYKKNEEKTKKEYENQNKTYYSEWPKSMEINPTNFKKMLSVKCKYVKDYKAIEIFEGPQFIRSAVYFCDHLAILVEAKYFNWIKGVNFGDGDEGCVYFEVRTNKDGTLAPINM